MTIENRRQVFTKHESTFLLPYPFSRRCLARFSWKINFVSAGVATRDQDNEDKSRKQRYTRNTRRSSSCILARIFQFILKLVSTRLNFSFTFRFYFFLPISQIPLLASIVRTNRRDTQLNRITWRNEGILRNRFVVKTAETACVARTACQDQQQVPGTPVQNQGTSNRKRSQREGWQTRNVETSLTSRWRFSGRSPNLTPA